MGIKKKEWEKTFYIECTQPLDLGDIEGLQ